MQQPVTDPDPPPKMIDWATVAATVECPLCLYNLRGLNEPRCPECGYRFQWSELLDAEHPNHPYLFEHHPHGNLRSFLRTMAAGIRARKFWRMLKPTHTLVLRRLLIYWLICCCLVLLIAPLAGMVELGTNVAIANAERRKRLPPAMRGQYTAATRQQYIDKYRPLPPHPAFFRLVGASFGQRFFIAAGASMILPLLWPWLTFMTLMIFQASMRKARVKPAHVLRCVIYSSDVLVWFMLATLILPLLAVFLIIWPNRALTMLLLAWTPLLLSLLLWGVRIDRLTVAYRRYLRFDHPFMTVISSQFIVWLAMLAITYWGFRLGLAQ